MHSSFVFMLPCVLVRSVVRFCCAGRCHALELETLLLQQKERKVLGKQGLGKKHRSHCFVLQSLQTSQRQLTRRHQLPVRGGHQTAAASIPARWPAANLFPWLLHCWL